MRTPNHKGACPCPKKWQPRWPNFSKSEVKNMNQVTLVGRLTKDPEIRQGQSMIANFTLAIDRPSSKGDKQTDFPKIVCFGKTAEIVKRYCYKGQLVGVEGRIQTGSYTNRDGNKVYTTDVVANRLNILEWPEKHGYDQWSETGPQLQQGETTYASGFGGGFGK